MQLAKSVSAFGAIALAFGIASQAEAAVTTYTVGALDGSQPGFSYDADKPAPAVTSSGFYAQGSANGGTNGDYNSVRFTPAAIGMSGLTLSQIASIAFDSTDTLVGPNWQMKIYTVPTTGVKTNFGNGVQEFYTTRLNYALSTSADGATHTYTHTATDGQDNRITLGHGENYYALQNGGTNYNSTLTGAANEQVLFFDISAGANGGGYDYNTLLNNITITNTSGDTSVISAVPEPMSLSMIALGGVALLRRRR